MTVTLECSPALQFALPDRLVATRPPESRGIRRDEVRMLVAEAGRGGAATRVRHARAADLPDFLDPGDLLVVNASQTLPAAMAGRTEGGEPVEVHLSTVRPDPSPGRVPDDPTGAALAACSSDWVVEFRLPATVGAGPCTADRTGGVVRLAGGGMLSVVGRAGPGTGPSRLWVAKIDTPGPLGTWLARQGQPIRYPYVDGAWPVGAYRTPHGTVPGSAEMPSAGRVLTGRLLRRVAAAGVHLAPVVLHCGVSSLESGDPPYPEWYAVPPATAAAVDRARAEERRVVAVGTTVVRALESVATGDGTVRSGRGWTDLVVGPQRGVTAVDGLLTGWHEPAATHLLMLAALAGDILLCDSYRAALTAGYLWHEFGDLHLLLAR